MKIKKTATSLMLRRETIQRLDPEILREVRGGEGCPLPDSMSGAATHTCAPAGGQ
jgi:hypothetical protein